MSTTAESANGDTKEQAPTGIDYIQLTGPIPATKRASSSSNTFLWTICE